MMTSQGSFLRKVSRSAWNRTRLQWHSPWFVLGYVVVVFAIVLVLSLMIRTFKTQTLLAWIAVQVTNLLLAYVTYVGAYASWQLHKRDFPKVGLVIAAKEPPFRVVVVNWSGSGSLVITKAVGHSVSSERRDRTPRELKMLQPENGDLPHLLEANRSCEFELEGAGGMVCRQDVVIEYISKYGKMWAYTSIVAP